jgi:CheY-like chemotaxis protein
MAVILIVEDDVFIRDLAELIIQEAGHETLLASDVAEALLILNTPQTIDLLFTDIYLKKLVNGGLELAQHAIKIRPSLPVLYTTGNIISEDMKKLFVKFSKFLSKPYTLLQLRESFQVLLKN